MDESFIQCGITVALAIHGLMAFFGTNAIQNLLMSGLLQVLPSYAMTAQQLKALGCGDALYDAKARGGDGTAILVADRLSLGRLPRVLRHELGEHHGLPRLLGPLRYSKLLEIVRRWRIHASLSISWRHVARFYPELEEGSDKFVREVIAHYGESPDPANCRQKLFSNLISRSLQRVIDLCRPPSCATQFSAPLRCESSNRFRRNRGAILRIVE